MQPSREGPGNLYQTLWTADTLHFPVAFFSISFAIIHLSWEYNLLLVLVSISDGWII